MSRFRPEQRAAMGQRLARVRKEAGLSQTTMAESLEVGLRTYQSYEQGLREIQGAIFPRLRRLYQIDPAWMIEGEVAGPRRRIEGMVDEATWYAAFRILDGVIERSGLEIETAKKVTLLKVAYRDMMKTGKVDEDKLRGLVEIAA